MANAVLESFQCPICFELAEEAVETSCCHTVFCQYCLSMINNKPCPNCREDFQIIVSYLSRKIIGNIPVQCTNKGCDVKIGKSELKAHQEKCPYHQFCCPGDGCMFTGLREDFAEHLAANHKDLLIQNVDKIFMKNQEIKSETNKSKDRITTRMNRGGRMCRLGSTGKFYCEGNLNGRRCSCCNGKCGPTNGCNCKDCMICDVLARNLPRGWYVNRDGAAARKSPETGHFYCGRLVIEDSRYCDGYCGPTNGPNCVACHQLESQLQLRYHDVWP